MRVEDTPVFAVVTTSAQEGQVRLADADVVWRRVVVLHATTTNKSAKQPRKVTTGRSSDVCIRDLCASMISARNFSEIASAGHDRSL